MAKNNDPLNLKIAFIGGGSRIWARTLTADLALESDLSGRIKLYDIDFPAAKMNETLGNWLGTHHKALLGLGDLTTNVNKKNIGQVSNLPPDVVVETNARFSRERVDPIAAGALPPGVETLVSTHAKNQEMIIEAALARDEELAFQAIFNDLCTTVAIDQAWIMFQEIGLPEKFH